MSAWSYGQQCSCRTSKYTPLKHINASILLYAEPSFPHESHPTQALPAHTFHTSSAATRRNGSKLSPHINAIVQNSNESLQISLESFFKQRRMLLFSPTLRAFLPRPAVLLLGTSKGASIPRTHLLGGSRSTESHSKTLSALFYAPSSNLRLRHSLLPHHIIRRPHTRQLFAPSSAV